MQAQTGAATAVLNDPATQYVQRSHHWRWLHPILDSLGDRVEKPGNEVVSITASLQHDSSADPSPRAVLLTKEFPEKLTAVGQVVGSRAAGTTNFDPRDSAAKNLATEEANLVDSLVYDSPEHLFLVRGLGAIGYLGPSFRSVQQNGALRFFDIYSLTETVFLGSAPQKEFRLYLFDSTTHLLAYVRHTSLRAGKKVAVETEYTGWTTQSGQALPSTVIRREDGVVVLTLKVASAGFSAKGGKQP